MFFLSQTIYQKALAIIENFFPDGDQADEEIAPRATDSGFEFAAAEGAVPSTGFQF
jgi:hypothetical protein